MVARGALSGDIGEGVLWFNHGFYLCDAPSNLVGMSISRPMLENGVRRRLLQFSNIELRERCEALQVAVEPGHGRVTGVRVQARGDPNNAETMSGDLVVDASGRGSLSPAWLAALGYVGPREEQIKVNVGYMTRQYRRLPEHLDGKLGAIIAACAPRWRFGGLLAQEGERWIVSLGGYMGDQVPPHDPGFLEFARSLPTPKIFDVIKEAEPLSPLASYQFNTNLRRHYEELDRFPEGFLAYGDALCSFDPVYGQGMTVTCAESLALHECLAAGAQGIARRFFKAASRLIDSPWQIAVGSDLQNPRVEGKRTAQTRFINWYIGKFFHAAHRDPVLTKKFLRVANLIEQPTALLDPRIAMRVWSGNRALTKQIV